MHTKIHNWKKCNEGNMFVLKQRMEVCFMVIVEQRMSTFVYLSWPESKMGLRSFQSESLSPLCGEVYLMDNKCCSHNQIISCQSVLYSSVLRKKIILTQKCSKFERGVAIAAIATNIAWWELET